MSVCALCGREIPEGATHLVYAFVGTEAQSDAMELCPKHSDAFAKFLEGSE